MRICRQHFLRNTIQHGDGILIIPVQLGVGQLFQGAFLRGFVQRLRQLLCFLFQLFILGSCDRERRIVLFQRRVHLLHGRDILVQKSADFCCFSFGIERMQVKLTIGERLKDLRTAQKLTLEQLAAEVGISKSALGKYELDNGKDISPYSILLLADYYGVSCDYLMGRTETKNHPNTALHELHLSDASIDVLRTGKFNHRLLSELICHKDFQRFMLDAEIYVDRIADMRVNDMNAVLEAVRQMALIKNGGEENDLHLRTLEVAQIREDEYFGSLIADDLKGILRDIRSEHRPDTMTADEVSFAENIQNQLRDAMNFVGSSEEKKAKALLATLGIDYDAITMEQFVNLIEVLKLSRHLKTPISQRGKTTMTHGKGKRKKR